MIESEWDKQMLTYAVEYSVMNDEAFSAFLNESSAAPQLPVKLNKSAPLENKEVQTDPDSRESSPSGTGESHPILGDLIQRQNLEIAKIRQEKLELRKDIQTLLSCVLTMQQLAKISSKGAICPPVPPEVTGIAAKYVTDGANYFASMMENGRAGSTTGHENSGLHQLHHHHHNSRDPAPYLKAVEEYEFDENYEREDPVSKPAVRSYYGNKRETSTGVLRGQRLFSSTETTRTTSSDDSSSHGIPPLDQDSDDNGSDHFNFDVAASASASSSSGAAPSGSSPHSPQMMGTGNGHGNGDASGGKLNHGGGSNNNNNNNGLSGNNISTLLM